MFAMSVPLSQWPTRTASLLVGVRPKDGMCLYNPLTVAQRPTLPISRPSRCSTPPLAPAQITLERGRRGGRRRGHGGGRRGGHGGHGRKSVKCAHSRAPDHSTSALDAKTSSRPLYAPSFPKLVFASTALAPPLLPATTPATVW